MRITPADSINELLFPATIAPASSTKTSEIECEVISLFEQFRNPLLRYVLSFGIPVHDAEEITQEAFLSLFRHLAAKKISKEPSGLALPRRA